MEKFFTPIGWAVTMAAVIGGYIMEGGNLHLLWQPAEFVIIGGAAIGAMIASCTPHIFIDTLKTMKTGMFLKQYNKEDYMEVIKLLNLIFTKMKKVGAIKMEGDFDDPEQSQVFQKFPNFLNAPVPLEFVTDSFRTIITTDIPYYDLNTLLESEIDEFHHEAEAKAQLLTDISESFPALGIVAAVLGVVITMQKISEPPEVLGHSIGAALVGTFLGVLLCYGFVSPLARKCKILATQEKEYLFVIKTVIIGYVAGINTNISLELGRRKIPHHVRPPFSEMEIAIRDSKQLLSN